MKKIGLVILVMICGWSPDTSATAADSTHPVVHMVLFQFKADASAEQIAGLLNSIRGIGKVIPGIVAVTGGQNFSERSKGYTHGVVMTFANAAALKNFYVHPEHQRLIREQIKPLLADMIVVDYETEVSHSSQQQKQ